MTRAAVCGAALEGAARLLGLEPTTDRPDVVLVDLRDPEAVSAAAALPHDAPRVALGDSGHASLLRALAAGVPFSLSAEPAELGPLVAAALPLPARRASRVLLITAPCGGTGRTLLAANLAQRLAAGRTVLVVDVTGSGGAAWWLGLSPGAWTELEGLVDELTPEHLAIVSAERGPLRVVGGPPVAPSLALSLAATRAAPGVADLVIVDAPPLPDERTRVLAELADRVLVLAPDGPASGSVLTAAGGERDWILGSRTGAVRIAGLPVLRSIPDDPRSAAAAARERRAATGGLGRAYDEIAELIAIDAS